LAISSSQLFASTFAMSDLSPSERKYMDEHYDDILIRYNETTDEVFLDREFERQLRKSGVLNTEDVKAGTACTGGGEQ
jgi:hypothetical protein